MTNNVYLTEKAKAQLDSGEGFDIDNSETIKSMRKASPEAFDGLSDEKMNEIINQSMAHTMKCLDLLTTWSQSSSYQALCAIEFLQCSLITEQGKADQVDGMREDFRRLRGLLVEEEFRDGVLDMEPTSTIEDSIVIGDRNFFRYLDNCKAKGIEFQEMVDLTIKEYVKGLEENVFEEASTLLMGVCQATMQ